MDRQPSNGRENCVSMPDLGLADWEREAFDEQGIEIPPTAPAPNCEPSSLGFDPVYAAKAWRWRRIGDAIEEKTLASEALGRRGASRARRNRDA